MAETFLPVPGFPGYRVSESGRVQSCWKPTKHVMTNQWRDLSAKVVDGYVRVNLQENKKSRAMHVHVLVATAFLGPCPPGMECRHLDGDGSNPHVSNLKWGTRLENMADRDLHGRTVRGSRMNTSKLNEDQVRSIIRRHREGEGIKALAREHAVRHSAIQWIVRGKNWKHLQEV